MLLLGLFLLGLVNSAGSAARSAGFFKAVLPGLPRLVDRADPLDRPVCRSCSGFFHSRLFTLSFRFVIKPLLWTAAVWWLCGAAA